MKKFLLVLITIFFNVSFLLAQSYNIDAVDGTTITDCTITLYDSGGSGGDYGSSESYYVTVCSGSTDAIEITFVDIDIETTYDDITIYDGTGTGGTILGSFDGTTLPGNVTSSSSCITIEFNSDSSVEYAGFELTTACVTPPTPCSGAINIPTVPVTNQAVVCGSSNDLNSGNVSICGGASNSYVGGNEAVYTFTPTETGVYSISYSGQTWSAIWVHSNACPSAGGTCVGSVGSSASAQTLDVTLTAGTTYYIWFDTYPSPDSPCPGTFSITPPPCTPANTTITQNCAADNSNYDLSIVISAMVEAATVNIVVGGTTEYSGVGVGTYPVNGLVSGTTVQIIDAADPTCIYSETISMCDLCNSPSAPSDECSAAPLIDLSQPFEGSTDCSYTVGAENPAESCGVSLDNDSWMTFIAGSTDVEIDYTVGDCEPISDGIQLNVFSGTCATLTEVPGSCVNPTGENTTGTWNFSGLTIGDTYYIRIDGYAGDLCDYYFEPVTGVVITPPNNACDDAILLNCGDTDIASNILADAVDSPSGCAGGGTPGDGVWYSFIGDGSEVTISTDNPGTNFDTEINIFEGPCTALTCVGGDNDGGVGMTSSFTFTTTNGTEYFIYVDGDGAAIGQFEVSLTCNTAVPCDADAGAWD